MKKNLLFVVMIIVSAVFYSAAPVSKEKLRVKTAIRCRGTRADTTTYIYNEDGHVSEIRNSAKGAFITGYQYLPGMILRNYHDKAGTVGFVDTFFLNKTGQIGKAISNNKVVASLNHQYDSLFHLVKSTHLDGTTKGAYTSYVYLNGNKISYTSFDASGAETGKGSYEYYTDRSNTIGNENTGMDFAGSDSKNPEKSNTYQLKGMAPFSYTSNYHYDGKGRVTVKAQYEIPSGKLSDSTTYTYIVLPDKK